MISPAMKKQKAIVAMKKVKRKKKISVPSLHHRQDKGQHKG